MKIVPWLLTFANLRVNPLLETSDLRRHHNEGSTTPQPMQDGIPITDDYCEIPKNFSYPETCQYVKLNSDSCEGGGYLLWTKYVFCQEHVVAKVFTIIGSIVFLVIMMIMASATANDFFSPCISGIGVTFMAFGNGANDVFGAIASVLSTDSPKADLAIGELLGAGTFVTLMVTAGIVLAQPFKLARRPVMRDLSFYLIADALVLFVFLYDDRVHIWQPAIFLALYLTYVCTVFLGHFQHRRAKRAKKIASRIASRAASRAQSIVNGGVVIQSIPVIEPVKEELEDDDDDDSSTDIVIEHGHIVFAGPDARSRAQSLRSAPMKVSTWRLFMLDIYLHLRPMTFKEFHEARWYGKIYGLVKIPTVFILKATVPVSENAWSKAVAILQTLLAPFVVLFCTQEVQASPPWGGPGYYVYCIGISVVITLFIIFFTTQDKEPRFYNMFSSFAGFVLSVLWVYKISTEMIDIVVMLGVLSHLSHEILGLTILAWSNSIGDLITDISVARQGYPKMAIAAVIGGQMFNLIIGFGVPFIIATASGTTVTITFSTVDHFLVMFLGISLTTSLIALPLQRFYARRPYAILLIIIYGTFLVFVILAQTKVIKW